MENKRTRNILIISLVLNGALVILSSVIGTMAFLGGLASCTVGAVNEITDTVEDIKDLPGNVEESVENVIGDSLPIGLK